MEPRLILILAALISLACNPSAPRGTYVPPQTSLVHAVRGVVDSNVANLAAFTVAGHDGLTYAEGECTLLVLQTSTAGNGPYCLGAVGGGVAALARPSYWTAGSVLPAGQTFIPNEGSRWRSRAWRVTTAGAVTADTTPVDLYPQTDSVLLTLNGQTPSYAQTTAFWKLPNGVNANIGVIAQSYFNGTSGEAYSLLVLGEGKPGVANVVVYGAPGSGNYALIHVTNF